MEEKSFALSNNPPEVYPPFIDLVLRPHFFPLSLQMISDPGSQIVNQNLGIDLLFYVPTGSGF